MKRRVINISTLLVLGIFSAKAQQILYITKAASSITPVLYVSNKGLLYAKSSVKVDNYGLVDNYGNMMVVASSGTDTFKVHESANSTANANFNLKFTDTSTYGQLYIQGYDPANITGYVNKEYKAKYKNSSDGSARQQTALPFYNFTIADISSVFPYGNFTNAALSSSGRFNPASAFYWNNARARFDQIASLIPTDPIDKVAAANMATNYYVLPARNSSGVVQWVPDTDLKVFTGRPSADNTASTTVSLSGGYTGSFGAGGSSANFYREKYNSYMDDPFVATKWSGTYGYNIYQFGNPFLTNIDLAFIGGASDPDGDGNAISNLYGVAYYDQNANLSWNNGGGTAVTGSVTIALADSNGNLNVGDVNTGTEKLMVKPLGEFMIKLSGAAIPAAAATLNFNGTRRFAMTSRASATPYAVNAARNSNVRSVSTVKQVAVILQDNAGNELGRTYYAVSQDALTGFQSTPMMQSYVSNYPIYTTEELPSGGADPSVINQELYINSANELAFSGKQIPLTIASTDQGSLKFEVYEDGKLLNADSSLSTGKSFYISDSNNNITQINTGTVLPLVGNSFGLYYDQPTSVLTTSENAKSQTFITQKNNQWVVKIANDWDNTAIHVYSTAGQLVYSKKNLTPDIYNIPVTVSGIYIVKVDSGNGKTITGKILVK